jgi:hypothetical protein
MIVTMSLNDRVGKDGLVGNGLLQRFKVTFDYPRQ